MTNIQVEEHPFLQSILDAVPYPMFVVDSDTKIIAFNQAAGRNLSDLSDQLILQRAGDVLKCLNANKTPMGCGRQEECKTCDIRQSVRNALRDGKTCRTRVKLATLAGHSTNINHLLISASPFDYRGSQYVLLVLEDINDLIALRNFVPICANCKNIRNEEKHRN